MLGDGHDERAGRNTDTDTNRDANRHTNSHTDGDPDCFADRGIDARGGACARGRGTTGGPPSVTPPGTTTPPTTPPPPRTGNAGLTDRDETSPLAVWSLVAVAVGISLGGRAIAPRRRG